MTDTIQRGFWVSTDDLSSSQERRLIAGTRELRSSILAEAGASERTSDGRWTAEAYRASLTRLRAEGKVVAASVIDMARDQGGYISREKVYEIGEYDPDRSLRGFTRPVRRVCESLREEGALAADAPDLLEADYDETISGYQRAGGFRVPAEVVELDLS